MDHHGIAEALQRFAQQYQPLVEAAQAFEKLGNLEQAIASATARHEQVLKDEAQATAELAGLRTDIDKAKGVAAQVISGAEKQAADMRKSASDEAAERVARAHVEIAGLHSKASADIESARAEAQVVLDDILEKIEQAKAEHEAHRGRVKEASAQHADLTEKIAKAKAAASRILS